MKYICTLILISLVISLQAADWPTFRGNNQRADQSNEELSLPLKQAWIHQPMHAPRPAWPGPAKMNMAVRHALEPTLNFDSAFHVVADQSSVYFGSSADDAIYCIDLTTGRERWRYVAEGPVRLAPALANGCVYAGSDDGNLYCLDAKAGTLKWQFFAGPNKKRLPGNGRMISLFPIRGGIVTDGPNVYFSAGIFPSRGVYLCAVNATSGKQVYKYKLAFTAQGIMLADKNRIIVSSGRTSYWSCDRETGKPTTRHGASNSWRKDLVGGSFAVLANGYLATGPSEGGQIHVFKGNSTKPMFRVYARCMIVHDQSVYLLSPKSLQRFEAKSFFVVRKRGKKPPQPTWSTQINGAGSMVLAGKTLFTGADKSITAFDAATGKQVWSAKVGSRVESMAICKERLIASLNNGHIVCFGGPSSTGVVKTTATQPSFGKASITTLAETAVKSLGIQKGYCLILNAGTGQLAYEIATRTKLRIVCRESDPAKVAQARATLSKAGLYGSRISYHLGSSETLPYPKYFANLVVSPTPLTATDQVLRVLRPYGGVVCAPGTANIPNWTISSGIGTARRGKLAGAGEWSHFYADTANTACSNDAIKAGPMDLQWFGRPGPREMVDRHKKAEAPLFTNGRMFIPGFNYVAAIDAYNGTVLWEKHIPKSVRIGAFKDSSSIAATDHHLLVAADQSCLVFDAQTGKELRRIDVPHKGNAWDYLAAVDGIIVGSSTRTGASLRAMGKAENAIIWHNAQPIVCSSTIFATRQNTGKPAWKYDATSGMIANPTITIADGRVFFLESKNAKSLESKTGRINLPEFIGKTTKLVAIDLKTGRKILSRDIDIHTIQHVLYLSYAHGRLIVTGSKHVNVDPSETKGRSKPKQLKRVRYDLFGFDAKTGAKVWNGTFMPDYDHVLSGGHGEQVQHPAIIGDVVYGPGFACNVFTGKPHSGWKWRKSHKCATVSASKYCAFSRYSGAKLPYIFDLASGKGTPLTTATRPGCWINMIPAGGLILIPEGSSGCSCPYPFQTSLALCPAN